MPCFSRLPSRFGGAALLLASALMSSACVPGRLDSGSEVSDGDTSPVGDSCSGSERRCEGNNLMVCDGAAVPANPGVNPSLTITALAEHAMAEVPAKEDRTSTALSAS